MQGGLLCNTPPISITFINFGFTPVYILVSECKYGHNVFTAIMAIDFNGKQYNSSEEWFYGLSKSMGFNVPTAIPIHRCKDKYKYFIHQ